MLEKIVTAFSSLPQVESIALGGSRAGETFDERSDYDLYLYCTAPVPEETRRRLLAPLTTYVEYGNHFWELEDNGTFVNGIDFDILYRNLEEISADVASVVEDFTPHNAYTTCIWHNLLHSRILFDRNGRLTETVRRFSVPYPEQLRRNILTQGWRLLTDSMPAYKDQITKALVRGDLVSVNHRTAAFLETYFDVLLAANRLTHPGEKRLVPYCKTHCTQLPEGFEEDLYLLFLTLFSDGDTAAATLRRMLAALSKCL